MAKTGKPHTIEEDLILPAAADMAGGKGKTNIQTMPSSNNTVSRRISDMAEDVSKLLLHAQASEFYALQLDESTLKLNSIRILSDFWIDCAQSTLHLPNALSRL